MRKILATIIAVTSLGYSSAFAGTLVINTDLTDPAPKAAFDWAFNKFQEENPDVTIEVNNFDHEGYKQAIRNFIKNLNSICVAYSGGVDSTLVASLAFEQLGSKAVAITGISPALANTLREEARSQAKWIGVKHLEIKTSELDQSSYSKNPKDRCFACKKELHKHTTFLSKKLNYKIVLDGVNLDDLKDYRPGIFSIFIFSFN